MKYLLDTCVVSELIKARPSKGVVDWIGGCDEESLFLSVLTIGEVQKGIAKLDDGKRRYEIQRWLNWDLRKRFAERMLPVDERISLNWGILQAKAEKDGTPVPTINGLIAATAITHNLTVATRDEGGLRHTGARVINPWAS